MGGHELRVIKDGKDLVQPYIAGNMYQFLDAVLSGLERKYSDSDSYVHFPNFRKHIAQMEIGKFEMPVDVAEKILKEISQLEKLSTEGVLTTKKDKQLFSDVLEGLKQIMTASVKEKIPVNVNNSP